MATVGRVVVDVDADTAKFVRKIERSTRRMDRFSRDVRNIARTAAGIFVSGAFAGMIRQTVREVDEIGKLTDRLGGSTEAFSELRHVAELSGIAFNTLTMGVQRMTRRIAEAAQGTGEAKDAIRELGLDAKALADLPLDQQFETIAERLHNVGNESDRTRLAMKLFDSEGVALLQTMTDGAAGIRRMREEAKQLGLSLSKEQVDAAEAANDAMTRLGGQVKALGNAFTIALTPAIEAASNALTDFLNTSIEEEIQSLRDQIRLFTEATRGPQLPEDSPFIQGLRLQIELLEARLKKQREVTDELQKVDVSGAVERSKRALEDFRKEQERVNEAVRVFNERFTVEQKFAAVKEAIRETSDELDDFIKTGENAFDPLVEAGKQAARNIQDAFSDFLFDPFDDGVKGMVKAFLDAIRRMLANQAAIQLFKFLKGFVPGGSSKESTPAPAPDGGGLPAFAQGGAFRVGGVGGTDSQIVAFRATPNEPVAVGGPAQMGGPSVTIIQNNDFSNADASIIPRIRGELEQARRAIKAEILNDMIEGRFQPA